MKRELAFRLLRRILPDPPWDEDRLRSTLKDLQVLADQKYNRYEMYQPARLFFENLYLFLNKLKEEHRTAALDFIHRRLIFISREEFQQLAHVLYYDRIRQEQLDLASKKSGIPRHLLARLSQSSELQRMKRASLYIALSDGARIDYFRRQNLEINNEQVLAAYYSSPDKIKDAQAKLRAAVNDIAAQFECIFLLDDFCGSGRTLLREVVTAIVAGNGLLPDVPVSLRGKLSCDTEKRELEWIYRGALTVEESRELAEYGKHLNEIAVCIEEIRQRCIVRETVMKGALQKISTSKIREVIAPEASICFAPLLATEYSVKRLGLLTPRLPKPFDGLRCIPAAQLPNSVRILPGDTQIGDVCETYYDTSLEDEHTSNVKYGYDGCGLPLILHHNTPNNSLYFLWARKWGFPLFPRYERHGREVRT